MVAIGERVGFDGMALARTSRLVAKVDSAAVQDGFALYLHGFIVTDDGSWVVVQQGMNDEPARAAATTGCPKVRSFVDEPHAAIEGPGGGEIVNLTDRRAEASRHAQLDLLRGLGPDGIVRELAAMADTLPTPAPKEPLLPHLVMPAHHDVRAGDVMLRRLHGALAAAATCGPADFAELLLVPGVGARTVRSLALVAEIVHGAPCRFADPARFSFAHGGKDRHPFPVPTKVYDHTIAVLKSAVAKAKLGQVERLDAVRRLDQQARRLERHASGSSLAELIGQERRQSHELGGRSVFGWEPAPAKGRDETTRAPVGRQMTLNI